VVYNRPVIHRELVDVAMYLKDCGLVRELEHISKTKLRGVLAILKQGDLVMKHGAVGEPVQLNLGEEIDTFSDLRDQHDRFLNSYMVENLLNIPIVLKNEIMWPVDEGVRVNRMRELKPLLDQMLMLAKEFVVKQAETSKSSDAEDGDAVFDGTHHGSSPNVHNHPQTPIAQQGNTEKGYSPTSQQAMFSKSPLMTDTAAYTPTLEDTYSNNIFTEERLTPSYILNSAAYLNEDNSSRELLSDAKELLTSEYSIVPE
jgi:hypothetical protein